MPYGNTTSIYHTYDENGYETIQQYRTGEDTLTFYVHRLLAVAEYGFDVVKGNDVHHLNGVGSDNRPSNLKVMGVSEHRKEHAKSRVRDDNGRFTSDVAEVCG